jgi:hypothetical protein
MGDNINFDYNETLEIYKEIINAIPEIQLKGKTVPYTSLNGNMFSFLDKDGILAIRFSEKEKEELIQEYNASLKISYGVIQKEYIKIPAALLKDKKTLTSYFIKSYEYTKVLKPKATKKNK